MNLVWRYLVPENIFVTITSLMGFQLIDGDIAPAGVSEYWLSTKSSFSNIQSSYWDTTLEDINDKNMSFMATFNKNWTEAPVLNSSKKGKILRRLEVTVAASNLLTHLQNDKSSYLTAIKTSQEPYFFEDLYKLSISIAYLLVYYEILMKSIGINREALSVRIRSGEKLWWFEENFTYLCNLSGEVRSALKERAFDLAVIPESEDEEESLQRNTLLKSVYVAATKYFEIPFDEEFISKNKLSLPQRNISSTLRVKKIDRKDKNVHFNEQVIKKYIKRTRGGQREIFEISTLNDIKDTGL